MADRLTFLIAAILSSAGTVAGELVDPTRPPPDIAAPVVAAGGAAERQPAGLQSVIISSTRRAAIIGGETVELGGKYGDAKLIEVNEGNVVLRGAQGRQVLTLFPDVKMRVAGGGKTTGRQAKKTKPGSPAGDVQPGKSGSGSPAHKEKR